MPCYEAPYSYEKAQKADQENAARLLCGFIKRKMIIREPIDNELLQWAENHYLIDLDVAKTHKRNSDIAEATANLELLSRCRAGYL